MKKVLNVLKNRDKLLLFLLQLKPFRILPDHIYLKIKYYLKIGKKLNLDNPKSFNEKLQWLKLYDRNPEYTQMVDKYQVRDYIKEKIGEDILVPLLGVYNNFEEINFDLLPNQFVLKPNHTSGDIFICKNKSEIDSKELKKIINKWLNRQYFWLHREWPYKNIRPKIICEKYLVDSSNEELIDYKLMCFNGEPKCILVASGRHSLTGLKIDFLDLEWNVLPFKREKPRSNKKIPKPKTFDKMVKIAKILSKDIPFVRVDFYEVNGQLYFGELTFYPGAGFEKFEPADYDYILGNWLKLPGSFEEKVTRRLEDHVI